MTGRFNVKSVTRYVVLKLRRQKSRSSGLTKFKSEVRRTA